MPSSPTTRNRLEKQEPGENLNAWGDKLNQTVIDLVDAAMDGMASFTLSGSKTLTSVNYAADEARMRFLNITSGTGGTVTLPATEKIYLVRNATTGDATFTTGSGDTATVYSGNKAFVVSDATNVYLANILDYGAALLSSSGTATDDAHLINKAFADAMAAELQVYTDNAVNGVIAAGLPDQSGAAGKTLVSDGVSATWQTPFSLPSQTGNDGKALITISGAESWGYSVKPWVSVTSDVTLAAKTQYNVTTTSARALNLPASPANGDAIVVSDITGTAATNNITLTPNGSDTIGGDASLVIDLNRARVTLVSRTGGWDLSA